MKCARCGKESKTVSIQPTVGQLIFGGYPFKTEARCQNCEKKVIERINKCVTTFVPADRK